MVVYLFWIKKKILEECEMELCDNLVNVGLVFMMLGMLFGVLWVKEVWGYYWSWDFKEMWVVVMWFGYFCYIYFWMNWR